MLDWYEFMARERQKELLRAAEKQCLIRGLRTARGKEHSRLHGHSQKKTLGVSEIKSRIIQMERAYRLYCRIVTVVFIIITVHPLTTKLLQERFADDWLHSVLHLGSALFGIYAGWYATNIAPAKVFTWGIGLLYFMLGVYGWFTPGFLLHTPVAIPIGVADNVFHLLLSVPALLIIVLATRRSLQATSHRGDPTLAYPKARLPSEKQGLQRCREERNGIM